jgi:hypothetical protein
MPGEAMRAGPSHATGADPPVQRDPLGTDNTINTEVNVVLPKKRGRPKKAQQVDLIK